MTKNVQGECQHCHGLFEFSAENVGLTADCPHCQQPTELLLATPLETASPTTTKAIVFTVIAVIILGGGVIGSLVALKRAKRISGQAAPPPKTQPASKPADPFAGQGFRVSPVVLEPTAGSTLVNARGTIVNIGNQTRYGLRVELDLFNASSNWIANAADYISILETNAEWKFTALVKDPKAVSARIATIKETK